MSMTVDQVVGRRAMRFDTNSSMMGMGEGWKNDEVRGWKDNEGARKECTYTNIESKHIRRFVAL